MRPCHGRPNTQWNNGSRCRNCRALTHRQNPARLGRRGFCRRIVFFRIADLAEEEDHHRTRNYRNVWIELWTTVGGLSECDFIWPPDRPPASKAEEVTVGLPCNLYRLPIRQSRKALLRAGKRAAAHFVAIAGHRVGDHSFHVGVRFHVARKSARRQADQVVDHQHLAVTAGAGANANRGNAERLGDFPCQFSGNALQKDGKRACLLRPQRPSANAPDRGCTE